MVLLDPFYVPSTLFPCGKRLWVSLRENIKKKKSIRKKVLKSYPAKIMGFVADGEIRRIKLPLLLSFSKSTLFSLLRLPCLM